MTCDDWPALSVTFCVHVLNPAYLIVTVYSPFGSAGSVNNPWASETALSLPGSTVTCAPCRVRPCTSVTDPVNGTRTVWQKTGDAASIVTHGTAHTTPLKRISLLMKSGARLIPVPVFCGTMCPTRYVLIRITLAGGLYISISSG